MAPSAYAADPIQITESADRYAKVTTLTTEKFNVPDVGSFFDPAFAYAWLSTILDPGFPPSVGLKVYFQRSNGWRFFDRAFDSDGNMLRVDVLARDVQYGSTVAEQFIARLSVSYLQSRREKGLDIRFDGKGGSLVVQLPPSYVQAMLDHLDHQVGNSPALGNTENAPNATQSNQPMPAQKKLRLGIRYLDEAMAAKMPEAMRAKLPTNGLLLVRIEPGSPAALAGLLAGDVLVEFAGQTITSPADMAAALDTVPPGGKVDAAVMRGGQTVRLGVQM